MKKVAGRSAAALILAGILTAGLLAILICFFVRGGHWAVFPGNPHVYTGGNLDAGVITDRGGAVLLDSTGGRAYAEDGAVRKATLHLLGDREGYIAAPLLSKYAGQLVGYSPLSGTYSLSGKHSTGRLTVSAAAQKRALELLEGRAGAVGVYNYKTGEILCAVSSPTYDPDDVPDIANDETGAYEGVYVNRFFNATFVPGSIFKLVTLAAALETIPDIEERTFSCGGSFEVEGDTVTCNGVHGAIGLKTALAKSCNVAFGQIALELGPEVLGAYAEKLGVTGRFSVDGFTTAAGRFDLEDAPDVDVAWAGIGQYTNLVNPCGYLRLMGVIAGGGEAAEPYLMAEVNSRKLTAGYRASTRRTGRLLEPETCRVMTELMRNNVVSTYGADRFPDLYVCAKSGTAEVGGGETPHATFAGFVAGSDYPLAFVVFVENAGSGSEVCASIAGGVLESCIEELDAE